MKKIMVIEDEIFMREEIVSILEKEGYEVSYIEQFTNILEKIIQESPDLVLLDLNLPGITGFEICKSLRAKNSVPILVLTSRDKLSDELHALDLGADEFLTKPCNTARLVARIASLLRRYDTKGDFIEGKGIKLDLQTYTLYTSQQSTVLSENQGKMMELFLENKESLVTKEILFDKIWGTSEYIDENALQVNMTRLKKTIKKLNLNYEIITIRGKGYKFVAIEEVKND